MTDNDKPLARHLGTAKEHLAGIKAAQTWIQELSAAGLLHAQQPIRDTPIQDEETG